MLPDRTRAIVILTVALVHFVIACYLCVMRNRDGLTRRLALTGVILATAVLSYSTLKERAIHIGFTPWATWLYPVGLDALILGASHTWMTTSLSGATRRLAKFITLGAITAGIMAFVAEFIGHGWIAVAFAVLIPASLAAALVLNARVTADGRVVPDAQPQPVSKDDGGAATEPTTYDPREQQPETDKLLPVDIAHAFDVPFELIDARAPVVQLVPPPTIPLAEDSAHVSPARDDARGEVRATVTPPADDAVLSGDEPASPETRKQWIRDQLAAGKNVTGADVDRQFPGGSRNGARLVRQVKEERESRA